MKFRAPKWQRLFEDQPTKERHMDNALWAFFGIAFGATAASAIWYRLTNKRKGHVSQDADDAGA
jgi:hypothetical protein